MYICIYLGTVFKNELVLVLVFIQKRKKSLAKKKEKEIPIPVDSSGSYKDNNKRTHYLQWFLPGVTFLENINSYNGFVENILLNLQE